MQPVEAALRTTRLRCVVYGVLLSAASASSLLALPAGYREDFNGCAAEPDEAERKRCCTKTTNDCYDECIRLHGESGQVSLACRADCLSKSVGCQLGTKIPEAIDWPEHPGLEVPWVRVEGGSLVVERGVELKRSDRSVVIEMRGDEAHAKLADCLAIVAACECPSGRQTGGSDGAYCRPTVGSERVECTICTASSGSEKCEPCAQCTPVVLAVERCEPP